MVGGRQDAIVVDTGANGLCETPAAGDDGQVVAVGADCRPCAFEVSVVALDTDPAVDDAANDETNTTTVELAVVDKNDL